MKASVSGSRFGTEASVAYAVSQKRESLRQAVLRFEGRNGRLYPWRQAHRSPYEVLLAEVLLKRTTAAAVARVYFDILNCFPTLKHLERAPILDVATRIAPIGLKTQRSQSLKKLALHLIDNEAGEIPSTLEALLNVPGVGQYSARAILSFVHGIPAAVVDANVERILLRVFNKALSPRPSPRTLQAVADKMLPLKRHRDFNFGLLDIGSLICRPKYPRCRECPLNKVCDYIGRPVSAPALTGLRRFRTAAGLSQVELAGRSGISKMTIIKIESGKTRPRSATTANLAAALGINAEDLS